MTTESPDGTTVDIPTSIVDDVGVVWSLSSAGSVLRNGIRKYVWSGKRLLWMGQRLYIAGFSDRGYLLDRYSGGALPLAPDDPLMEILVPKPQINSFAATPPSVQPGGSTVLTWSSSNGKRAYLDGVAVPTSGSMTVKLSVTHLYKLVVQGKGPDASAQVIVTVVQSQPAQTIDSFAANPSMIVAGQSDTVAWQTSNATEVRLDGNIVPAIGSKTETPAASINHTLVAKGSGPDVTRSVSVTVTPPPPPLDRPPVWQTVPTLTFTQGTASSVPVGQYASDPDGDPLTFTLASGTLPAGIVFDGPTARFFYDGRDLGAQAGAPIVISGITVGADDLRA